MLDKSHLMYKISVYKKGIIYRFMSGYGWASIIKVRNDIFLLRIFFFTRRKGESAYVQW